MSLLKLKLELDGLFQDVSKEYYRRRADLDDVGQVPIDEIIEDVRDIRTELRLTPES